MYLRTTEASYTSSVARSVFKKTQDLDITKAVSTKCPNIVFVQTINEMKEEICSQRKSNLSKVYLSTHPVHKTKNAIPIPYSIQDSILSDSIPKIHHLNPYSKPLLQEALCSAAFQCAPSSLTLFPRLSLARSCVLQ